MSDTPRGLTGVSRRPDPKRMLAKNRTAPAEDVPVEETAAPEEATAVDAEKQPSAAQSKPRTSLPRPTSSTTTTREEAGYLEYERKEARFREGVVSELTAHARRLNRMKTDKTAPRITENTLIRVAIDLLLSRANDLQGNTEEELRNSVTL